MRHSMSLNARHELIQSIAQRYHQASKTDKERILDELVAATGYHRKSATRLLHSGMGLYAGTFAAE